MGTKITAEIFCDGCGHSHKWITAKYSIGKTGMVDFVRRELGWKLIKGKIYCLTCCEKVRCTHEQ